MESSKIMNVVSCILYELQPFRYVDAVSFVEYSALSTKDLSIAAFAGSEFLYQNGFEFVTHLSLTTWLYIGLWLAVLALFAYLEFASLWVLFSMICSIFLNLGTKKAGELSAYSVFNKGFKQLLGTMNADQFDNEIRHNPMPRELDNMDDFVQLADVLDRDRDDVQEREGVKEPEGPRRKGKKGRRNYEERLLRREQRLMEQEEEEDFDDDDM
ncbi:hypothetical protein B484DRAFT_458098 [Ochromonadaceae sp. CCMP2298]|nr:hypothetical protein B484DRAFT_458098 [Ochromonadaceae sp. CCMP2298]|mmetsp:Transcript_13150/g.29147  ORF Transcript_13150/g.29147 Transcript_13150/m.29147 type:complete len:213 (+) Transcript_13150:195-833(+)